MRTCWRTCVDGIVTMTLKHANNPMKLLATGRFVAWTWASKWLLQHNDARHLGKQILAPAVWGARIAMTANPPSTQGVMVGLVLCDHVRLNDARRAIVGELHQAAGLGWPDKEVCAYLRARSDAYQIIGQTELILI